MAEIWRLPLTVIHRVEADGVQVFYREAGRQDALVVLLLHGFPASSFQFRELIPRLADRYRVIAPDLPGFGFTEVPEGRNYTYTFDGLANTILAFKEFGISKDNVRINMAAVRDRKRTMVDGLVKMHIDNFKSSGAELL